LNAVHQKHPSCNPGPGFTSLKLSRLKDLTREELAD
jgi:hypothetical protein